MSDSIRQELNDLIKARGEITYNELRNFCDDREPICKLSYAERLLRPSISPKVKAEMKKGYIIGYRWVGELKQSVINLD